MNNVLNVAATHTRVKKSEQNIELHILCKLDAYK